MYLRRPTWMAAVQVKRVHNVSTAQHFHEEVSRLREPAVLCGLDLGPAPELWTPQYLREKCGNQPVKVHVCPSKQMDFINKNFAYKTLPFDEFVTRCGLREHPEHFICKGESYYLRALGSGDPRKSVADFPSDYPALAGDLRLPCLFPQDRYFSSVLRMGSPGVQLWTHYDVMDNLLVQVVGKKKVVLFPPSDAPYLYLVGDKSRVLDLDQPDLSSFPLFPQASRHETLLCPGEVLYMPALWFHNVTALEFGVAVNVFWKHLGEEFYDAKDTYGNRDPPQVQRALQVVERAAKLLEGLPQDYRQFYGWRLRTHLEEKLKQAGQETEQVIKQTGKD